jgi:ketopantoate reductase
MQITVLGTGTVGQLLAGRFAELSHEATDPLGRHRRLILDVATPHDDGSGQGNVQLPGRSVAARSPVGWLKCVVRLVTWG